MAVPRWQAFALFSLLPLLACDDGPLGPEPATERSAAAVPEAFLASFTSTGGLGQTSRGRAPATAVYCLFFNDGHMPWIPFGAAQVGCDHAHPGFGPLTLDLTPANSPRFTAFAARLADDADDLLMSIGVVLDETGAIVLGGGGGNFESDWFTPRWQSRGMPNALVRAREVTRIRLIVERSELTLGQPFDRWEYQLRWELYGNPRPRR